MLVFLFVCFLVCFFFFVFLNSKLRTLLAGRSLSLTDTTVTTDASDFPKYSTLPVLTARFTVVKDFYFGIPSMKKMYSVRYSSLSGRSHRMVFAQKVVC